MHFCYLWKYNSTNRSGVIALIWLTVASKLVLGRLSNRNRKPNTLATIEHNRNRDISKANYILIKCCTISVVRYQLEPSRPVFRAYMLLSHPSFSYVSYSLTENIKIENIKKLWLMFTAVSGSRREAFAADERFYWHLYQVLEQSVCLAGPGNFLSLQDHKYLYLYSALFVGSDIVVSIVIMSYFSQITAFKLLTCWFCFWKGTQSVRNNRFQWITTRLLNWCVCVCVLDICLLKIVIFSFICFFSTSVSLLISVIKVMDSCVSYLDQLHTVTSMLTFVFISKSQTLVCGCVYNFETPTMYCLGFSYLRSEAWPHYEQVVSIWFCLLSPWVSCPLSSPLNIVVYL